MKKCIIYWKFQKKKNCNAYGYNAYSLLIVQGKEQPVRESVNPTDVASVTYQPTKKFWTGHLKCSFHFSGILWHR